MRVQTRNPDHRVAKELAQLPNVTFHVGHIESDQLLRDAMQGMDAVFFNANSFSIGEKAETFWSMRAFELAIEAGVKFFQFSNLDYSLKKGGYDPKFRCAHYDGKGRIAGTPPIHYTYVVVDTLISLVPDISNFAHLEWIQHQPLSPMKWAILTSGMSFSQRLGGDIIF